MMPRPTLAVISMCLLGACANFPEVDASISPGALEAGFPELVSVDGVRERLEANPIEASEAASVEAGADEARINALKARAARLQNDVLDQDEKDDLDREIEIENDAI